jgi:hypothetical protein
MLLGLLWLSLPRINVLFFTHDADCLVIDMYAIAEALGDRRMLSNTE